MTAQARLVTELQAAEALQVCVRTLRKARQQGALPFVQIGRTIRYLESDLASFIERSRQCHSTNGKARRSGNTRSRSEVFDFEALRAARESEKRQR